MQTFIITFISAFIAYYLVQFLYDKYKKEKKEEKDYVFCDECGVAVKKEKAQVVTDFYNYYLGLGLGNNKKYYCQEHKKPYDVIDIDYKTNKIIYIKNQVKVKVDKKGKIIK